MEDKRVHLILDENINVEQRDAIVSVIVSRGNKSAQRDIFVVQTGGYWDMVGDFPLFWDSDITESQKEIISQMIMNLVFVRGGEFVMGTEDESHNVKLSDFYISKYELTQAEWNAVMATNESYYKGSNLPVTNLSVEDVQKYLKQLKYICGMDFRLPTEAQWEFAARGGLKSMGYLYSGGDDYNNVGHFVPSFTNDYDVRMTTYPVGQFTPNELGLYDMSGNVAELCYDLYDDYSLEDQVDPMGPSGSGLKYHVSRGFGFDDFYYSVYDRTIWSENSNSDGFRLVLML
jgi:formylglycine-generating enzyme required for sulfatase activity